MQNCKKEDGKYDFSELSGFMGPMMQGGVMKQGKAVPGILRDTLSVYQKFKCHKRNYIFSSSIFLLLKIVCCAVAEPLKLSDVSNLVSPKEAGGLKARKGEVKRT